MELSVPAPDLGASAGTYAPTPLHALMPEQAKKIFEFFSKGTTRHVILLGDVVEQRMHFVSEPKRHKVLCTAITGSCELCLKAATSETISTSHPEFLAPAVIRTGERGDFKQQVAVFTLAMEEQLRELLTDGPGRGYRFELRRESHHKFKIILDRRAPHTLAHALPMSFDVLPWIRARFGLPQDPVNPPVRIPNFSCREVPGPAARPKPLALTASDRQSAEEWEATKAKIAEAKEHAKSDDAPRPPAAEKKPGSLAVAELVSDPTNYGEPTLAGVGTEDAPLIDPPDADGKLLTRPSVASLNERRKKAADEAERRKAAAESGGSDNALSLDDLVTDVLPLSTLRTGTHAAKKGGTK